MLECLFHQVNNPDTEQLLLLYQKIAKTNTKIKLSQITNICKRIFFFFFNVKKIILPA